MNQRSAIRTTLVLLNRRQFLSIPLRLTGRGIILACLIAYLLLQPVFLHSDIVAAVLAFGFLALILVFGLISFIKGRSLRSKIELRVRSGGISGEEVRSGERAVVVIGTSPLRIPPFFRLSYAVSFVSQTLTLPEIVVSGVSPAGVSLREEILFPHRGVWEFDKIGVRFGDTLGLTVYTWEATFSSGEEAIVAHPPVPSDPKLPIISSTFREGDLIPVTHEATGDPYDLKRYNPSDGLKKIVWKIYARTGELLSRHQENSMTPEGQTVLFCLAGRDEDSVCGEAISYLQMLEKLEIEVFASCKGAGKQLSARSADEAEALFIETAWSCEGESQLSSTVELEGLLTNFFASKPHARLERLVLVTSVERCGDPQGAAELNALGSYLKGRQITPVFVVTKGQSSLSKESISSKSSFKRALSLFWYDDDFKGTRLGVGDPSRFIATSRSQGWEVLGI